MTTENNISIIKPIEEIAAYETLWESSKASFKTIAELFKKNPGIKPTELVSKSQYEKNLLKLKEIFTDLRKENNYRPNMLINGVVDYPEKLRSAIEPVELFYYTGNLELIYSRSIAIVGARKPSDDGRKRARKLARLLTNDGFTIVSGLAAGIDTEAHKTAIENGGKTIAVIGTPLNSVYPKENSKLQNYIAHRHLLISQVPFIKYENQDYRSNRLFFPERNKTMSAITEATIIVEASDTSGTLIQARAALQQGRALFILESCFQNKDITWPSYYEKKGAVRVKDFSDIINVLKK